MRACEWANSKLVTDVGNRHLAETKKIAAELEQENREMMLLRKSRMREFLKAEAEVFEQQVRARHTHTSCLSRGPARSGICQPSRRGTRLLMAPQPFRISRSAVELHGQGLLQRGAVTRDVCLRVRVET